MPDGSGATLRGGYMGESSRNLILREPGSADWQAIGRLANAAVEHVPGAPSQDDWVASRRSFAGEQSHRVAEREGAVVGYAAVERRAEEPEGLYRVFVVTSWRDTPDVADALYETVAAELARRGARHAWLREYADDEILIRFMHERGFRVRERYFRGGSELVTLERDLARDGPSPRSD